MRSPACSWLLLPAVLLGACASGSGYTGPSLRTADVEWSALWPELADPKAASAGEFRPRAPTGQRLERLQAAERAFEALADVPEGDPAAAAEAERAWTEARDAVASDPLAAFWIGRRLLFAVVVNVDQRSADEEGMIDGAGSSRARRELVALGEVAAPVVVLDLLRSDRADRRELGVALLREMGPSAMPALRRVLDVEDVRTRRYAVRAVAGWPSTAAGREVLLDAVRDPDFGVRAEAWRGFVHGPEDLALLEQALQGRETDPFARRSVHEALGAFRSLRAAELLVAELERAIAAGDGDSIRSSRAALQQMTGRGDLAGPVEFRRFLDGWNPEPEPAPIERQR